VKPLIIGEAPSKNEATERPIEGRIAKRLAKCAGLSLEEFLEHFDRVNLLHVRQDTKDKGFLFDLPAAKVEATRIVTTIKPHQVVILLGGRVAEAFGIHHEYFVEVPLGEGFAYIVPHPSGVNRWWNSPYNVRNASVFMHSIIYAAKSTGVIEEQR
jgi:uracil-DNA glycosylase